MNEKSRNEIRTERILAYAFLTIILVLFAGLVVILLWWLAGVV